MTARSPRYSGRLRPAARITGEGEDEVAAPAYLALKLRVLRDAERRMVLESEGTSGPPADPRT